MTVTTDSGLADFDASRRRLFGIAYRMLGSVAEAEDVVQETWLRWQQTDRTAVESPAAFLTTVTTRLAITVAQSARKRREVYVGPWLPEPVDTSADPALGAENGAALEAAVLVLLERLPARERAAYVLREAFDYPYPRVAEILEIGEANARQVVTRARQHVAAHRSAPVDRTEHRRLLEAFVDAARGGDLAALERLLAADVVSASDGAGVAPSAARVPVVGRSKVARLVAGFRERFWTGSTLTWVETNGQPSVLVRHGDAATAVLSIEAGPEGIEQLLWVMAPAKLSQIGTLSGQD